MEERKRLEVWANTLVGSLRGTGVRHAVISPGSRSTPFAAAALRQGLQCHSLIDERAAGFFALGLARATGEPPLLVCTSGTAGAHYFPAVLEAREAGLPLIVLTADRPLELMDRGAPQTLDQIKLFGDRVRAFFELGEPVSSAPALQALRGRAALAASRARWPLPGPVHLNARAKKPLEPTGASLPTGATPRIATPEVQVPESEIDLLAELCLGSRRGLLVAGAELPRTSGMRRAAMDLARATGFALAPDASSGLRFGSCDHLTRLHHFGTLLECEESAAALDHVDLVVQLGRAPIAPAWPQFLRARAARGLQHVVLAAAEPSDPAQTATHVVLGSEEAAATQLARRIEQLRTERARRADLLWAEELAALDERLGRVVDDVLRERSWSEGLVARALVEAMAERGPATLMLANSLPIRLVETFGGGVEAPLEVLAQRGVNGIDGLVAGLAGWIAGSAPSPTALLVGDVALLHDASSLRLLASVQDRPVVVLVLNNDGGRIFEQLPLAAERTGPDLDLWTTPHGLHFEDLARHAGLNYARAADEHGLRAALERALTTPGACVVEAVSAPGDAAEERRALVARARAEVGGAAS